MAGRTWRAPVVAGAAVAAALALALVLADAGRAGLARDGGHAALRTASAEATPTAALTTVVLGDVTVRKGRTATLRYRCDHEDGGAVVADLVVTDRRGRIVRTLVHGKTVPGGLAQTWRGTVTLAAGRYTVTAHARDAAGRAESRATPAALVVRKPLPAAVPARRPGAPPSPGRRGAPVTWPSPWSTAAVACTGTTHGTASRAPAWSRPCCWSRTSAVTTRSVRP